MRIVYNTFNFFFFLEFDGAECLYISEVRIILDAQEDSKENGTDTRPRTK